MAHHDIIFHGTANRYDNIENFEDKTLKFFVHVPGHDSEKPHYSTHGSYMIRLSVISENCSQFRIHPDGTEQEVKNSKITGPLLNAIGREVKSGFLVGVDND